jgi:hypothetical protein
MHWLEPKARQTITPLERGRKRHYLTRHGLVESCDGATQAGQGRGNRSIFLEQAHEALVG